MYELKIDKKIRRRATIQNTLIGIFLLFGIAYAIHPLYSHYNGESENTAILKKKSKNLSPGFRIAINREIFSILAGILGGFIGYSMKDQTARDLQRRKDLNDLIKKGQKNEKA